MAKKNYSTALFIFDDSCRHQIVEKGNNEANKIGMDLAPNQIHRLLQRSNHPLCEHS